MNLPLSTHTLGELCKVIAGGTPSRSRPELYGGNIPWVKIGDMLQGTIRTTEEYITETALLESAAKLLPANTVLLSIFATIGRTAVLARPSATNQAIVGIVPNDRRLDAHYLRQFLDFAAPQLASQGRGVAQNNINSSILKALKVPLPPLEDQKRIAALLDKADALRRKRQEALRLTDGFLRASFLDMFGDPLTNTRQLPMKPLREFGEIVTGNTPPRSEPENFGSAVEWIKSDNINTPNYYLTPAEERLSSLGAAKARKVPANSILVTCIAGSPSCIGNVALTNREVAFNQQINAVVPAQNTDPFFLFTQLLVGKQKIQNASTNGMKGMVSKGTFSEIEFLAPPEAKQREFGNIFRHIEELHRKNEDAFTATETLFSALQQRAFSGEL